MLIQERRPAQDRSSAIAAVFADRPGSPMARRRRSNRTPSRPANLTRHSIDASRSPSRRQSRKGRAAAADRHCRSTARRSGVLCRLSTAPIRTPRPRAGTPPAIGRARTSGTDAKALASLLGRQRQCRDRFEHRRPAPRSSGCRRVRRAGARAASTACGWSSRPDTRGRGSATGGDNSTERRRDVAAENLTVSKLLPSSTW